MTCISRSKRILAGLAICLAMAAFPAAAAPQGQQAVGSILIWGQLEAAKSACQWMAPRFEEALNLDARRAVMDSDASLSGTALTAATTERLSLVRETATATRRTLALTENGCREALQQANALIRLVLDTGTPS
jgi:hypothetical protein